MPQQTKRKSGLVGSLLQFNWLPRIGTVTVKDFFFLWLAGVFYPIGLIPWDRLKLEGNRVAGDWRKNKDKEKNPVLLIHGYFHNGSAYLLLKHRLEKAGWRHVYSINLSSKKTIEQSAERLAEDVEKILHQTGAHRVDVIAHSMGGLVARYYVQFLEGYKKVERCVTLACPNQGTELYLFAVTPCGRQLNPRGQFITKINQDNLDKLRYIYTASVWSAYDLMILPSEYARWPQGTADIAIDSVGHWGLLYSSEVFEALQKLLAEKSKLPALRVVRPNVA